MFGVWDYLSPQEVVEMQIVNKRLYQVVPQFLREMEICSEEILCHDSVQEGPFKIYHKVARCTWFVDSYNNLKFKVAPLMEFLVNDIFGPFFELSHEYWFRVSTTTYIVFPLARDTKSLY